ncbi:MAG: lysophospholipid acyltransferase family protein [Kofleriaceae bacterium]
MSHRDGNGHGAPPGARDDEPDEPATTARATRTPKGSVGPSGRGGAADERDARGDEDDREPEDVEDLEDLEDAAEAEDAEDAEDAADADGWGEAGGGGPGASWPISVAGDLRFLEDDVYLGEEAVVPPGEYGTYPSSLPREDVDSAEIAELERRIGADRTPAFPLDLRRHLPLEALWRRWRALAMWGRSDLVDDFGRDPKATARWEWLLEFLYSAWFRVECEGLQHVPRTGRALLVANHAGTLPYDSLMLVHAVRRDHPARRDVRPLVEDPVFHLPFLGPIMNRIGGVRADPDNAERLLQRDELVAVFPEGEKGMGKLWRDRYRLQRFGRGGFVRLALRTGAPIIPVAIVGAEEAAPMVGKITWFAKSVGIPWVPVTMTFPWLGPAGLLPLPSKWRLRFGEPLDVAKIYGRAAADDRLLVNRVADEIRSNLQASVNSLLSTRRSAVLPAFFG